MFPNVCKHYLIIYGCLKFTSKKVGKMLINYFQVLPVSVRVCFEKTQNYFRDHSSITSSKRWVGGVRKWKFLMIYSTVNHHRVGWVGLKKSKT